MRVYELAKKLGVASKDITDFLSTKDKVYKNMNGLTEDEEKRVISKFGKSTNTANTNVAKEEKQVKVSSATPKTADDKTTDVGDKKKNTFHLSFKDNRDNKKTRDVKRPLNKGQNRDNNSSNGERKNNFNRDNHNKDSQERNNSSRDNKDNRNREGQPRNNDNRGQRGNNNRSFQNRDNSSSNGERKNNFNRDNHNKDGQERNNSSRDNKSFQNRSSDNKPFNSFDGKNQGRRTDNRSDNRNGQGKKFENKSAAPAENTFAKPGAGKHDKHVKTKDNKKNNKDFKPEVAIEKPKKKEEVIKEIVVGEYITIKELADKLKKTPASLVKDLFIKGKVVTINTEIDFEQVEEICLEYDVLCEKEVQIDVIAELLKENEEDESKMTKRPPVVAVMGHVDHGKTSLLDAIRKTNVTNKESGGITQKIGAYQVKTKEGNSVTFLDTPGHEAFTAMRMRGAQSTDIAVLVVAADDGVMPQTIEAINHAKAANVEIIVAVNKIDKPTANVDKVKQELMEYGLISEEWGGTTIFCPVSAHTGEGIEELLDMILLTSDVLELKANKNRKARGMIIEAELNKGRGVVATVLVQKGTLKVGDSVAAGSSFGKIRAMINDKNKRVKEAGPSTPVEILGLNEVPNAGEVIMAFDNDKEARNFASTFIAEDKRKMVAESKHKMSLDDLFDQIKTGDLKELNIIVKADVQGSVEAIKASLEKLSNDEVVVKIIHGGVGNINESDVILASASNAIIIGFNVKPDPRAEQSAETEEVDLRLYSVIYDAIDDVEAALKGMLEPIYEERVIGHAEIRQIFKASAVGNIAGSIVTDGKITSKAKVKVFRGTDIVFDGNIASLRRFKDEVKEIKGGYECGIVFDGFDKIEEGDIVEASEMFEIPRT